MFRNKIVWLALFAILPASLHAQASDALHETKILADRAHYWDRLGRSDMAVQAWQKLLLAEPGNAEALAGLARHQAQPENKSDQGSDAASTGSGNVTRDPAVSSEVIPVPQPVSEPAAPPDVSVPIQPGGEVRKVEDWGDLYVGGLKENAQAAESNVKMEHGVAPPLGAMPFSNQAVDSNGYLEKDLPAGTRGQSAVAADAAVSESNNTVSANPARKIPTRAETFMAAQPGGQTEKWADFYARGFKVASPQDELNATSGPSGSLLVNDKPSRKELLDQAQYWESRGRSDLSAKIRKRTGTAEPKQAVEPAADKLVAPTNPESFTRPDFISPATGKPEARFERAVTERSVTTDRKMVKNAPATDSHTQVEVVPAENIPAVAAVKTTRQELLDRAQYWESRGRSDLAATVHNQSSPGEPKQDGAALSRSPIVNARVVAAERTMARNTAASDIPAQTGFAAPESSKTSGGATLSQQELDEQAQYWEARGRTDLADKARNQSGPMELKGMGAGTGRNATARVALAERQIARNILTSDSRSQREPGTPENGPTSGGATPSREELDEQAQYWEARGRSDLAEQLRKKLQSLEPGYSTGMSRRTGREMIQEPSLPVVKVRGNEDASRSALEDSLLKNPDSLSIRLDLAKIYQSAGEVAKARVQIDSVLAANPDMPEALYASAQLYATQHLWWEALHTLDKISPVSRTTDMGKLQKTAWAHVQIDRADALVRQGNNAEAEVLLRQVAVELAVNYNQTRLAEPPPLWKSVTHGKQKGKR